MEVFVPLYISNYCDSSCKMCNFRRENLALSRKEASHSEIFAQLDIIKNFEGISAVCILTGERKSKRDRIHNLNLVSWTISAAFEFGFERIFFNIGSLLQDEVDFLSQSIPKSKKASVVLSLFQETYDRSAYYDYFGFNQDSSKADFDQRLKTVDLWVGAGFNKIDIGILLGFKKEFSSDVEQLISHATRFISSGVEVYVSTPRVKNGLVDDASYLSILHKLKSALPTAKLIVTTRESVDFINLNLSLFDVISPGSSDICPYAYSDIISNHKESSQFVISEVRPSPLIVLRQIYQPSFKFFRNPGA